MRIGIIGVGMVGGALVRWFRKNTNHEIRLYDPLKNLNEDLTGCEAVFICIPVPPAHGKGQDYTNLEASVALAKMHTDKVFIRSTVLPGTNDRLGTFSCPEFLTARNADEDMDRLKILVGYKEIPLEIMSFMYKVFPGKTNFLFLRNKECEMAKYAHNVHGAVKVTLWNIFYELCKEHGISYEYMLQGALASGHVGAQHTMVPGPDGLRGYGGACFPENVESFRCFAKMQIPFFENVQRLNTIFRDLPA